MLIIGKKHSLDFGEGPTDGLNYTAIMVEAKHFVNIT